MGKGKASSWKLTRLELSQNGSEGAAATHTMYIVRMANTEKTVRW